MGCPIQRQTVLSSLKGSFWSPATLCTMGLKQNKGTIDFFTV